MEMSNIISQNDAGNETKDHRVSFNPEPALEHPVGDERLAAAPEAAILPWAAKRSCLDEALRFPMWHPRFLFTILTHPSPELSEPFKRRRGRAYAILSLVLFLSGIVAFAVARVNDVGNTFIAVTEGLALAIVFVSYALSRTQHLALAIYVGIFAIWALCCASIGDSMYDKDHEHFAWANEGNWIYSPVWMSFTAMFCSLPACAMFASANVLVLLLLPAFVGAPFYFLSDVLLFQAFCTPAMLCACFVIRRDLHFMRSFKRLGSRDERNDSETDRVTHSRGKIWEHSFGSIRFWRSLLIEPSDRITSSIERRRGRAISGNLLWATVLCFACVCADHSSEGLLAVLPLLGCFFLCYLLSRTAWPMMGLRICLAFIIVWPYVLYGTKGDAYFERTLFINLTGTALAFILSSAFLPVIDLLLFSVVEIALLIYNPFFHPEFAVAFILPALALLSWLDRRDIKAMGTEDSEAIVTSNPMHIQRATSDFSMWQDSKISESHRRLLSTATAGIMLVALFTGLIVSHQLGQYECVLPLGP